ncbi:MAG: hypothetical protein V8Q54_09570 [Alistipes senegalensis]
MVKTSCRGLFPAGIHRGRRSGDRGRLARIGLLRDTARDMQDTFFVEKDPDILLRTHTSSIQVRTMERQKPPHPRHLPRPRVCNEAISYRAHCIFHQIEGLHRRGSLVRRHETVAALLAKEVFGEQTVIRMRPSYFPFTEPSAEVDVSCNLCGGKGCPSAKARDGWRSWVAAWWTRTC